MEDFLQGMTYNAVNLLTGMLQIPSCSFEEEERADFLYEYLKERALKLNMQQKGIPDIIVCRVVNNIILYRDNFSAEKQTLMLNSHIDTVTPAPTYSFDPFAPFEKDGCIYGLGQQ